MRCFLKDLPVIVLLSLTSCGGGYIKCSTLVVGDTTYRSEKETTLYVFAYKADDAPAMADLAGEKHDTLYAYHLAEESDDKGKIAVPKTCSYHYGSSDLYDLELKYYGEMGNYVSYTTVFYSSSKKLVRIENALNKPNKNNHSKELLSQKLYPIKFKVDDSGKQVPILDVSSRSGYYPFNSDESIRYVEIGDSTVSYTLYKN